jgi:hypothetical protein
METLPNDVLSLIFKQMCNVDAIMVALSSPILYHNIKSLNYSMYPGYKLMHAVVKEGNINQVKYLINHNNYKYTNYIYNAAIESGNIKLLKFLRSICVLKFAIKKKSIFKAVKNGHLEMLKYVLQIRNFEFFNKIKNGIYDHALAFHQKEIFNWISDIGDVRRRSTLYIIFSIPQTMESLLWVNAILSPTTDEIFCALASCCLPTFKIILHLTQLKISLKNWGNS